jgi:predicted nucleotidyltransferase
MIASDLVIDIIEYLKTIDPEKIILFGSHAYGIARQDSDIDLLIVKDISEIEVRPLRLFLKRNLWLKFKNNHLLFDILVDSENRIKQRIKIGDLFYKEIYNKGKILYAK